MRKILLLAVLASLSLPAHAGTIRLPIAPIPSNPWTYSCPKPLSWSKTQGKCVRRIYADTQQDDDFDSNGSIDEMSYDEIIELAQPRRSIHRR